MKAQRTRRVKSTKSSKVEPHYNKLTKQQSDPNLTQKSQNKFANQELNREFRTVKLGKKSKNCEDRDERDKISSTSE